MLEKLKNKMIVSCQALEDEPLFGSDMMTKMAIAAKEGGASGIRAQGVDDIVAIKKVLDLPVIGIIKRNYPNCCVYITPTKKEVEELLGTGCEIIALDATNRSRPNGEKIEDLVELIHKNSVLAMADCSTIEEAIQAEKLGFDIISSTLSGHTEYTEERDKPDFKLLEDMVAKTNVPIFAEGHIWTKEDVTRISKIGVYSIVVGTAITRPALITERFVSALAFNNKGEKNGK